MRLRPITIIGAGGIVRDAHLPAYRKAGFPVAAVCDRNRQRAQELAATFGIPAVYGNVVEAIAAAPADGVFDLATPPEAFVEILNLLPHGAAVLIQKPLGTCIQQADEIRSICRSRKLTAAVNFQLRFAPAIQKAREMISAGIIGEVHDMEVRITVFTPWHLWPFLEGMPRMEILYHSIHYIDLMRSFLGEPRAVWARTVKHPAVPKLASARSIIVLDYGDMVRSTITTNHGHNYGFQNQESYVKWEGARGAIKTQLGLLMDYPRGVPDNYQFCVLEEGKSPVWQDHAIEGSWFPDGFIGTMGSLMQYLNGTADTLPTSVEDAYRTMEVVEAAYESDDSGGTAVRHG